jgi:DsbC/DsbD-like thiol-disulfide interchange protein
MRFAVKMIRPKERGARRALVAALRRPSAGTTLAVLILAFAGLACSPAASSASPEASASPPFSPAPQQDDQVVEAKALLSRDGVRPGETVKAAIILKVQPGYHINDNAPLDEFMFPTALTFEENPNVEVVETYYPAGRRARFSYSEAELVVYEGEATLGVLLKAKAGIAPGTLKLKATLSYQACDNMSCLPPKELPFEISVPVVPPSKECRDLHPEIFSKIPFRTAAK